MQRLLDDVGRLLGPDEWSRMAVPMVDVALDVANKAAHSGEGSTPNRFPGEDPKPSLDQIQPGATFRGEVKMDPRVFAEPLVYGWRGVGGGVVQDDVKILSRVIVGHAFQEGQKVRAGMAGPTFAHDPSGR